MLLAVSYAIVRWGLPRLRRWWRLRRLRKELRQLRAAIRETDHVLGHAAGHAEDTAHALSALLRRAVLLGLPSAVLAGVHGEQWLATLWRIAPDEQALQRRPDLVTVLPYQAEPEVGDLDALADVVESVLTALSRNPRC